MKLAYRAFDKKGRQVTDVIEAASASEATEKLRGQDLFVADISQTAPSRPTRPKRTRRRFGTTRRLKNLALFSRQLYVLVHSGVQLADALWALKRQAKDATWRDVITDVRARLEKGLSLSDAMKSHPDYFGTVYRSMIAAGETSGTLATMLERLANLTQRQLHVRSAVQGALIYPILLISVVTVVMSILMVFVVPRFGELFQTLSVPLPPTTSVLISLSEAVRSYWWAMGAVMAAAAMGVRFYLRTPRGRRAMDSMILRLPPIGGIVRSFANAQIARQLGILMQSHLPVLEALRLTRDSVPNVHYAELMARTEEAVAAGYPISSTFGETDLISPSVYEATRSGEKSGQVGSLLMNLADFLDEENEVTLRSLTSIMEPVLLIVMGIVVGFVALSMFLPLFDITSMTGGAP